jgi:hypothetical protein
MLAIFFFYFVALFVESLKIKPCVFQLWEILSYYFFDNSPFLFVLSLLNSYQ